MIYPALATGWRVHTSGVRINVTKGYFDNQSEFPDTGSRSFRHSLLKEAYENKHYPIDASEPLELIKAHMEMHGRTQQI